jgi:peptidoglycan/LPS O-acetylase OafA/YrhL
MHFWPNVGIWRAAVPFTNMGWMGVDLFFVLSGFLITGILLDSIDRPDYYRRFYRRRAFRIFPLYYVLLILIVLLLASWRQGFYLAKLKTEWGSPVWFFFFLGNFVSSYRGMLPQIAPLTPTWSLQIEEQFYIFYPFLVQRLRGKVWILLLTLVAAAPIWRVSMLIVYPDNFMIQYASTLSRMDSLAAGGLATIIVRYLEKERENRLLRIVVAWLMPTSFAAIIAMYCSVGIVSGTPVTRTLGYSLNAVAFASLIVWTVQSRNKMQTAPFRLGAVMWLGKVSYGVYLLQLPIQTLVKVITGTGLGSPQRTVGQGILGIAGTLLVAWLSWKLFEKPVLDWGTKPESSHNRNPRRGLGGQLYAFVTARYKTLHGARLRIHHP